jgi:hypothetical protein
MSNCYEKSKVQGPKSKVIAAGKTPALSFHALRVGHRPMRSCYEKLDVGEGGSHGLEARATGDGGPLPPPRTL